MKNRIKYAWAANKIRPEDMAILHAIKEKTRMPITRLIAEAVNEYIQTRFTEIP